MKQLESKTALAKTKKGGGLSFTVLSYILLILSCVRGHLLGLLKRNQLSVHIGLQTQNEGQPLSCGGNPVQESVRSVGALADGKGEMSADGLMN